jgi:hypothetical protein
VRLNRISLVEHLLIIDKPLTISYLGVAGEGKELTPTGGQVVLNIGSGVSDVDETVFAEVGVCKGFDH